jgi:thiamine pyrophosphokinase
MPAEEKSMRPVVVPIDVTQHDPSSFAAVVLGGGDLHPAVRPILERASLIVAADSGASHTLALGLRPDVVVGDSDSIDAEALLMLHAEGIPFEHHPTDKDATDGELAIEYARKAGFDRVTLVTGGSIERLDHVLALVAQVSASECTTDAYIGTAHIQRVEPGRPLMFEETIGATLTLLAMCARVEGITTTGLLWPLSDEPLWPGCTRGVSNLVLTSPIEVTVGSGTLIAISPDAF